MTEDPRMTGDQPTGLASLDAFLAGEADTVFRLSRLPEFTELIPALDDLYEQAFAVLSGRPPTVLALFFMVCRRGLLAAAATILRGRADDAAAVTRRTIEVAKRAIAIHHNPANLQRWLASESREARWQARNDGHRPSRKTEPPVLEYPEKHEVLDQLGFLEGVFSDAFVHFTPEQLSALRIQYPDQGSKKLRLSYLIEDVWTVRNQLSILCAVHVHVFHAFDESCDRVLSQDRGWLTAFADLSQRGAAVAEKLHAEDEAYRASLRGGSG